MTCYQPEGSSESCISGISETQSLLALSHTVYWPHLGPLSSVLQPLLVIRHCVLAAQTSPLLPGAGLVFSCGTVTVSPREPLSGKHAEPVVQL